MTGYNYTPEVGEWYRFEAQDGRTMTGQVTQTDDETVTLEAGSDYTVSHGALIAHVVGAEYEI